MSIRFNREPALLPTLSKYHYIVKVNTYNAYSCGQVANFLYT